MRTRSRNLKISLSVSVALITLGAFSLVAPISSAASTIPLGTAGSYGVLAGTAGISNTGTTTITGDVGSSPSGTHTGFGTLTTTGASHFADAAAATAQGDALTAYNNAVAQPSTGTIVADLGGQILSPGVYTSGSSIGITGTLTLDAGGDPNAVFIFKAGSTLTTASGSSVVITHGGSQCNVFWQIGSSATLGTNSTMRGTILASASITATTGATVLGRLLALNTAVTLDSNVITVPTCTAPVTVPPVTVPPVTVPPVIAPPPTVCPVFTTLPAVTSTTDNSLTISWMAKLTGSWQIMTHGNTVLDSGNGAGGVSTISKLTTYSSNTQTLILYSGPNQTGCRLAQAITGTTAGGPVLPPLPPIVVPTPTTPPVVPLPPVPPVQVPVKPKGPVKTGDGSLGKVKR
jgi:hypothetical protein